MNCIIQDETFFENGMPKRNVQLRNFESVAVYVPHPTTEFQVRVGCSIRVVELARCCCHFRCLRGSCCEEYNMRQQCHGLCRLRTAFLMISMEIVLSRYQTSVLRRYEFLFAGAGISFRFH